MGLKEEEVLGRDDGRTYGQQLVEKQGDGERLVGNMSTQGASKAELQ